MHLLFLKRVGRTDCARRLLQLALERGANVAIRAGGFGASADEAASEYEALFARGIINSRMILDCLRILAELGRMEELAVILDRERLLRQVEIDLPAPGNDGQSLASAVEALLLENEAQAVHQEAVQSVRNMRMLKKFTQLDHPGAVALTGALEGETRRYLQGWSRSDHPFARFVPLDFRIDGWGLISRGPGYNIPHIHQQGWATGIYYPTSVEGEGGVLCVGRPADAAGTDEDWGPHCIRPRGGLLVLMPSFYTHWTTPLAQQGLRTSIAFDVVSPAGFEPATY